MKISSDEMRKKDILGKFIKKPNVSCMHSLKKSSEDPDGFSAFIIYMLGCREMYVDNGEGQLCLAGEGYKWLTYLSLKEYWSVTAFFNPHNELIECYFDISRCNFLDENGTPCIDDIFLDLVLMPDGRTITVDADELENALKQNLITIDDYNHALKIRRQIIETKWSNVDYLSKFINNLILDHGEFIKEMQIGKG